MGQPIVGAVGAGRRSKQLHRSSAHRIGRMGACAYQGVWMDASIVAGEADTARRANHAGPVGSRVWAGHGSCRGFELGAGVR